MSPRPDFPDHPARVLIVDDELHNRRVLEGMLAPEGYELMTAANGEDALATVARQPPDLILLDVMMPGMDGYQEAANGEDAEKVFARHAASIDLVVTDVMMPGCGGPELLGRLQAQAPDLRVLYMSGYAKQSPLHVAGIARGLPFVQKPFTAAEFVRNVREALDR